MCEIFHASNEFLFVIEKYLLLLLSFPMSSFDVEFEILTGVLLGIHFFLDLTLCDTVTQYYVPEDMNPLSPCILDVFTLLSEAPVSFVASICPHISAWLFLYMYMSFNIIYF
jgi:hypothetical protein